MHFVEQTVAAFGRIETCGPQDKHGRACTVATADVVTAPTNYAKALTRLPLDLAAVLAEFVNQAPRRIRNGDLAVQNVVPVHAISVQCVIPALVSLNDGAVKANPGKNALAP
jgi:hypothetical protein